MSTSWIIPCNVKYFDVVEHFKNNDCIYWKRGAGERVGDYVYVYVGVPYKQIMYRCMVIDDCVDEETMKGYSYATKGNVGRVYRYMKLEKDYTFDKPISLETLQDLGVSVIRKQVRADRFVIRYIMSEYTDMPTHS